MFEPRQSSFKFSFPEPDLSYVITSSFEQLPADKILMQNQRLLHAIAFSSDFRCMASIASSVGTGQLLYLIAIVCCVRMQQG